MKQERIICLWFWCQHTCRSKTLIVNQRRVIAANPFHRIRRVRNDGIKRFFISEVRLSQRIAQLDIKLVVVDVVQKHVHTCQVIGRMVDFLSEKAFFNDMVIKLLFSLQQQWAGTRCRVVDFVNVGLPVHSQLCNQLGDVLRCKELTAWLTGICRIVRNQELIGITEQVNLMFVEVTKF